jgi:hypothetical protein
MGTVSALGAAELLLRAMGPSSSHRIWLGPGPSPSGPSSRPDSRVVRGTELQWAEPDEQLGWRNRPGTWKSLEAGHAAMTFLADGQRRSLAVPKPDAGAVLLFGGSYTQAYGVRDEDTFFYRLNREFDDREFASYGTGGYGTVQSMLLAERVLDETPPERQPELLMYGFVKGHPKRNVAKPGWILELTDASGRIVVPPYVRLRDGRLKRHPHEVIERWSLANRAELAALGQRLWIHATYGVTRSERFTATKVLLDEFAGLADVRDVEFAVVVLGSDAESFEALFSDPPFAVLDCRYEDGPELRLGGNGHPNEKVHELWEGCIGDWLRARDRG